MKKNKIKILIIVMLLLLSVGCTTTLKDKDNKVVKNPETGQNLTKNILCRPTDEETIKIYKENEVNINELVECEKFTITTGGYEGLWTTIFVKPLAFFILTIGNLVKSNGLALILTSLFIRLVAYPITKKTAIQSELIKKAKPDLDRLEKKYKDKTDRDAMMKKSQEMTAIYKKYNINPVSSCLYAALQLPLFIAFLEAINRVPAIFEETFVGLQLGTTPSVGIQNGNFIYIAIILLVGITTYYSFKMNSSANPDNPQSQTTFKIMCGMIIVMSVFMSSALGIYWITTNLFTIVQNLLVKKEKL